MCCVLSMCLILPMRSEASMVPVSIRTMAFVAEGLQLSPYALFETWNGSVDLLFALQGNLNVV